MQKTLHRETLSTTEGQNDTEERNMNTNEITRRFTGCANEVHKNPGPGPLESAYEECLASELEKQGLHARRRQPTPITYKDIKLDCGYRIGILVEYNVIIELCGTLCNSN